MNGPAAMRLRDVVVVHDQSGARWRAGRAAICEGLVVVLPQSAIPPGFLVATGTYSIEAIDGGNRTRCFPQLAYSAERSAPPQEYVFD
jgi:hypothetical protein